MTDDRHSTDDLIGVPETMMIPLYARATETQRGGIVNDPHAVEMLARIDYDFSRFQDSEASVLGVAIRTEVLDERTLNFIERFPNAQIVNIASGLDTRFCRVDNGKIRWMDLDLPESMALRRRFITPGDRHSMIEGDALDPAWMDQIDADRPTLFILEGLIFYLPEDGVKALFGKLAARFPGAELLCEVIGVSMAKKTAQHDSVSRTGAQFQWGIRHAEAMADWHPAIAYVDDVSVYDRYDDRWHALDLDWPAPLNALRNTTNRIVHLRFETT